MPFFKAAGKLVYYAHVPKCGGSSIASYITDRFGPLAFHENRYLDVAEPQRWTKSSPQHVDALVLERLLPLSLFDAVFTVVRHPVPRLVSTYHFQLELQKSIPESTSFSAWLDQLDPNPVATPFAYDNHIRPMSKIVPEGAAVFHMEHGLDALVGWFDLLEGKIGAQRALIPENRRGDHVKTGTARVKPSAADLARIHHLYREDFDRFGYVTEHTKPAALPPVLSAEFLAERDRALAAAKRPLAVLRRKIKKRLALL